MSEDSAVVYGPHPVFVVVDKCTKVTPVDPDPSHRPLDMQSIERLPIHTLDEFYKFCEDGDSLAHVRKNVDDWYQTGNFDNSAWGEYAVDADISIEYYVVGYLHELYYREEAHARVCSRASARAQKRTTKARVKEMKTSRASRTDRA